MSDTDPLLRELLDKQAITEVIHLYCRGIDRVDCDMLRGLFHRDSTHKHGAFSGRSHDFIELAVEQVSKLRSTTHQIGNVLIRLDGDTAYTEAYYFVHHRVPAPSGLPADDEDYLAHGRYIDRFERRDGIWKISHRNGIWDWRIWRKASDRGFYDLPEEQRSRRGRGDLCYQDF